MKSQNKKLSLKKVTVLNFDQASRVLGGTDNEACPFTSDPIGCPSDPAKDDSCNVCLTNEPTCPEGCTSPTQDEECMSY